MQRYVFPNGYLEAARLDPYLSMPSRRIFDSSVWRGIPSFAAAPEGPEIRPRVSARAASIISTSRFSSAERPRLGESPSDSGVSQLSSTTKVSVSLRMTARSTTFCNSRMFPGVLADMANSFASLFCEAPNEVLHQQWNVIHSLA